MTRHEAVRMATKELEAAGHEAADFAARTIMAHVTDDDAGMVMLRADGPLAHQQSVAFDRLVGKVIEGVPLFRAIGVREFHGLDFAISSETLEPRDDTETLIEAVLAQSPQLDSHFADLGTGSGIIAISLLHEMAQAKGVATDVSDNALSTTLENAVANGVADRLSTTCGEWCEPLEGLFDFIVSNPPYIASEVVDGLHPSVLNHDPRRALDGGLDGLDAYRAILAEASDYLLPSGFLALEIGYDQADNVTALAEENGWCRIALQRDLQGHDRALVFRPA
ncbi:MAG: peptide chain release factor N(5)-glutamine methyltransferase [Pseudomonadota bacterium]